MKHNMKLIYSYKLNKLKNRIMIDSQDDIISE